MTLKRSRAAVTRFFLIGAYTPSPYAFNDAVLITSNKHTKFDGTEPLVVAFHGHGGVGYNMGVPFPYFGHQLIELARAGYIVISIDAAGPRGWPSPLTQTVIDAAIAWAQAPRVDEDFAGGLGAKPGKIATYGYSMGGGNAITYAKNHPAKVAAVMAINPAINLDVFFGPEIDALYAGAQFGYASGAVTLTAAPQSVTVQGGTAQFDAAGTIARWGASDVRAFSYTGKTGTQLTGCTSSTGNLPVTNGNVLAQGGKYTGHEGHNAHYDAQLGLYSPGAYDIPTKLTHGLADTTVTPAMIDPFLADANNPLIHEVVHIPANHTDVFQYMPSDADVAWLAAYLN